MPLACVLISDITGSTQLYEKESNERALEFISPVLDRMRELIAARDGHCVKSKGDDTISFFRHPDWAFEAAWDMINEDWDHGMSIHAGMYFGEVLHQEAGLYGNAVNTAARLASLAKPGEVLIGENCFNQMSERNRKKLLAIGDLHLKGKEDPTAVFAASVPSLAPTTVIFGKTMQSERPQRTEMVELIFRGETWRIGDGETLSLGRSPECDIVLDHGWVSRRHGELAIRSWQLEYTDHSSAGSVLQTVDGNELSIHRRTTMLNGSGTIILGPRESASDESSIRFIAHDMRISTK